MQVLEVSEKETAVQELCASEAEESDDEMKGGGDTPLQIKKHYKVQFYIRKPMRIDDPEHPGKTISGYTPGFFAFNLLCKDKLTDLAS